MRSRCLAALSTAALVLGCDGLEPLDDEAPAVGGAVQEIVGGVATADYQGVPQIRTFFNDGSGGNCTGSLISQRVVLTAAHCVDPDPGLSVTSVEARFGPTSLSNPNFFATIPVEDYFWFQNWDFYGDDLALLLLERDAEIEPVLYNTTTLTGSDLGKTMTYVGFGVTYTDGADDGTKRVATGPLVDFQNSKVLLYGDSEGGTCSGDSGGPGFMTVGGQQKVVSITSFHTGGCGLYGGNGGTRVAYYASTISQYIAQHDIPIPPEVSFAEPANNGEVRDGFSMRINATDNSRIDRVETYVDGVFSNTHTTSPYVEFVEGLSVGIHTLEARAYDNRGDSTTATIQVQVVPGGGVGDVCTGDGDCASDLCATVGGDSLCTTTCTVDDQCPEGFECLDGTACWPKRSGGGGCRATNSPVQGRWALLALAMTAALSRRRRR